MGQEDDLILAYRLRRSVPESGHFMMDEQPSLFYRMLFEALGKKEP